jgi:hypothetical protein
MKVKKLIKELKKLNLESEIKFLLGWDIDQGNIYKDVTMVYDDLCDRDCPGCDSCDPDIVGPVVIS